MPRPPVLLNSCALIPPSNLLRFSHSPESLVTHHKSRVLILLRTLCHGEKSQLFCNQANPRSFAKTPGWGHTLQNAPAESATYKLFCLQTTHPRPDPARPRVSRVTDHESPVTSFCSPFVFITLRIALSANPFVSQPSALPGVSVRIHLRSFRLELVAFFRHTGAGLRGTTTSLTEQTCVSNPKLQPAWTSRAARSISGRSIYFTQGR